MSMFRRMFGLPEMPKPQPGVPVGRQQMAGYVFSASLDMAEIGRSSGLRAIRKGATGAVPDSLGFHLGLLSFSMAPFLIRLGDRYGEEVAREVVRLASGRAVEFYQKKVKGGASDLEWHSLVEPMVTDAEHYAAGASSVLSDDSYREFLNEAYVRMSGVVDHGAASGLWDHFLRVSNVAEHLIGSVPIANP